MKVKIVGIYSLLLMHDYLAM